MTAVTTPTSSTIANDSPRREFVAGLRDTIPLIIGSFAFGIIYGATATANGMSPLAVIGMSLFVFAGSAQFIAANLFTSGVAVPVIILTTFVVNLRHALYSATLAPYLKGLPQRWLVPLAFWLTDETFAVTTLHYQRTESPYRRYYQLASSLAMYIDWNFWTIVGVIAGTTIQNPGRWGLDYSMVVTFTGLVVGAVKDRPAVLSVIVAGIVSVLTYGIENKLGLIISAAWGIAAGVLAESALASAKSRETKTS